MKNFNCEEYTFSVDGLTGQNYSICDEISALKKRVQSLEKENVETTNTLYEIMNRLDLLELKDGL